MNGLRRIAIKLLVNDKGKFFTLIIGVAFAVFLIMQMTSIFSGVMHRTAANIFNLRAKVWVMDPAVRIQSESVAMPNYVLNAVRSMKGVSYAVPLFQGGGLLKLASGKYQSATIIGLDDATLFGRPRIIEGDILHLYKNDAYIVMKDAEYRKLDNPPIGAVFEVNDHRGVVVALGKAVVGGLFGSPMLYTTYTRAISTLPTSRNTISYILVEPKDEAAIAVIKQQVSDLGYLALTSNEFVAKNRNYYLFQTGLGTNILIMTVISFVVGLSISGQTFYTFVLENLEEFGALKAIGARRHELIQMILYQAAMVGFIGYGLGVLLSSTLIALAKLRLPNYASMVTYQNMSLAFVMVIVIVSVSSYLGIRKVIRIDPFDIFRG